MQYKNTLQLIQGLKAEMWGQTPKTQICRNVLWPSALSLLGTWTSFGWLLFREKGNTTPWLCFPEETESVWATLKATDETPIKITEILLVNYRLEVKERNLNIQIIQTYYILHGSHLCHKLFFLISFSHCDILVFSEEDSPQITSINWYTITFWKRAHSQKQPELPNFL